MLATLGPRPFPGGPSSTCSSHRLQRQLQLRFHETAVHAPGFGGALPLAARKPSPDSHRACVPVQPRGAGGQVLAGTELPQRPQRPLPLLVQTPEAEKPEAALAATLARSPPPLRSVFCVHTCQFRPWTGCLSTLRWDWPNQRLASGREGEGRRGERDPPGPLARLCDSEPPHPALLRVLPSSPLHIWSQYKECESFSGQGSLNSRWRDCVPGSVGFEGTRGQAFKVMRLTFSAEPRFTQGTMVLSSVRLLGQERKHICTSLLPAT